MVGGEALEPPRRDRRRFALRLELAGDRRGHLRRPRKLALECPLRGSPKAGSRRVWASGQTARADQQRPWERGAGAASSSRRSARPRCHRLRSYDGLVGLVDVGQQRGPRDLPPAGGRGPGQRPIVRCVHDVRDRLQRPVRDQLPHVRERGAVLSKPSGEVTQRKGWGTVYGCPLAAHPPFPGHIYLVIFTCSRPSHIPTPSHNGGTRARLLNRLIAAAGRPL
jgi:hypothetical protein